MHSVAYLLDTGAQPGLFPKYFLPTDCLSEISREVELSVSSASEHRLEASGSNPLQFGIGDVLTSVLKVVINVAIDVLLDTAFIDDHILALLTAERNVAA